MGWRHSHWLREKGDVLVKMQQIAQPYDLQLYINIMSIERGYYGNMDGTKFHADVRWLRKPPFWRDAGCHHQQMWGSRCRRCGPRHRRASQRKASGRSLRSPPRGPLLPPGYTLRHTQVDDVLGFVGKPFPFPMIMYTDDAGLLFRPMKQRCTLSQVKRH